jgi:hypothetical protein
MHGHCIVGVFETRDAAEQARLKLKSAGVKEEDIQLSQDGAGAPAEGQSEGFFEWLFGEGSPSRDRDWYRSNLTGGRTAVSILAADNQDRIRLSEQLAQAGALDLVEEGDTGLAQDAQTAQGSVEEVIPVAKEELQAGKRAMERSIACARGWLSAQPKPP